MKHAEFVVEAESPLGVIRGVSLAAAHIEKGDLQGEDAMPRHSIKVKWRVVEVVRPTDVAKGSILPKDIADLSAVAPNMPDITSMDIEDAKGIVATAASGDELDVLEQVEKASSRTKGGRKGVLKFIGERRAELEASKVKKEKEAAARAAGEVKKDDGKVLTQGGAVVQGPKG